MIAVGGAAGAIARFLLGAYIDQRMGARFPYGTFVVNMSGCFVIGISMAMLTNRGYLGPNWRYLVPIGFIGAYTTFSTFEYETLRAIQDGQWLSGGLNVLLSVVAGFVMVWLGAATGRALA